MQRLRTLQGQGMISLQALEDAEVRRNLAQSDQLAARARVVAARQQLQRTEVRAPFDGIVSERRASVGDTAQVGRELLKVFDPRSLRLEGLVSADRVGEIAVGQKVVFRVNGYPGVEFEGQVRRLDAAANAATRQLAVQVAITGRDLPRVAGLFAEGRIETGQRRVVAVPEASLVRDGEEGFVWKLADGQLRKAPVKLGERDARTAQVEVLAGLAEGERILRRPSGPLSDGRAFRWVAPPGAGAASSAAPASAPASSSPSVPASAPRG